MFKNIKEFTKTPQFRMTSAWILFWGSLIGWPLSIWLTDEPVFILSLSWFAITITAWDVINTTELKE